MMPMPDFPCRTPAIPCTDDAADEGVSVAHLLPMGVLQAERRRQNVPRERLAERLTDESDLDVALAMSSYWEEQGRALARVGRARTLLVGDRLKAKRTARECHAKAEAYHDICVALVVDAAIQRPRPSRVPDLFAGVIPPIRQRAV